MRALPILLFLALAAPASAATPAKAPDKPPECTGVPGTNQDLPHLMAPLEKNGELYGYAYVTSCVAATSESAFSEIGDKIPYIQDAFVRDVNHMPVATPDADGNPVVDAAALQARLLADVRRVIGASKIKELVILDLQVSPLHPDQTPVLASAPPPDAPPAAPPPAP
ncbi:MAG TPA: hypothetical protein VIJ72_00330 [Rhizomicrobium sp.]